MIRTALRPRSLFHTGLLAAALLLAGCVAEEEPITGSPNVTVLPGATFTITERVLEGSSQMTVRGTVKNNGKGTWSPPWKIEGEFYSDSTFTLKLGGANKSYSFSLEKGASAPFELKFKSTTLTLSNYPNFAVKNLRAFQ